MAVLRDIVAKVWGGTANEPLDATLDDHGLFPTDPAKPVVLVTAFGVPAPALNAALDSALSGQVSGCRVVCLTDQPDFAVLRRRGIAFEYLPPPGARSEGIADARSWQAYLTERYDILLAKWRPDQVIAAGTSLERFVAGT